MSQMIETVARSMARLITEPGQHPDANMVHCMAMARVAMEAMKHYTFDMEQAGMAAMARGEPFELIWNTAINVGLRS